MGLTTHSQIARIAGLSRSTVSRALQNHPAIPEETRQRVQKLAKKLGYRPNPLVSALMASRNKPAADTSAVTIATLTAWPPTRELAPEPSTRRLLRGAEERANELGYRLEEFWIDEPGMGWKRLNQILLSRGIIAVLLAPVPNNHDDVHLEWDNFSIGTFAPSNQFPRFHRTSHFHFSGACLALEEVHRRGYRRPGMVLYSHDAQHVHEQYLGGMAAIGKRGIFRSQIPPLVLKDKSPNELLRWLKRHQPDVIVGNDLLTPQRLKEIGYPVPRKMAFASLDRPPGVDVAGVDQLKELIGRSVIDLIVAQIHRNERGVPQYSKDIKLPGVWMDGASLPSIP